MNMHHDWRFRVPGDTIRVHMIDYEKGEKLFDASLALQRRRLNRRALTLVLLSYPVMTGKVIALIYWQALRLLIKRIPLFDHSPTSQSVAAHPLRPVKESRNETEQI